MLLAVQLASAQLTPIGKTLRPSSVLRVVGKSGHEASEWRISDLLVPKMTDEQTVARWHSCRRTTIQFDDRVPSDFPGRKLGHERISL